MAIELKVVGLDIAKNVFQVHGLNRRGETVDCLHRSCSDVSPRTVQTGPVNQVWRQLGLAEAPLIAYASTFV